MRMRGDVVISIPTLLSMVGERKPSHLANRSKSVYLLSAPSDLPSTYLPFHEIEVSLNSSELALVFL